MRTCCRISRVGVLIFAAFSARGLYAQQPYERGVGVMIGAGFVTEGPAIVCGPSNQYASAGVYPRFGGQLYAVAILELWAEASERCATPISGGGSPGTTQYLMQPKMRGGVGVGVDRRVDEVNFVFRAGAGMLGTKEPWVSGGAGVRYHRFFIQGELGLSRVGWFMGDVRTRTEWTRLSAFHVGLLL